MKKLLIVESPAKIKTISKFLGNDFKIIATLGHIKDLPPHSLGVTIKDTVELEYTVLEGKEKTVAALVKEARTAQEIYLGPDPDREGEIIAWHAQEEILKAQTKNQKIHRITFNEITKSAIEDALAHPSTIDLAKVAAQQARRVLDRWVGYQVSPILWRKMAKGLSAGRVQSVALKLICDREEAIRLFKVEEYWSIDTLFVAPGIALTAPLTHINKKKAEITNEKDATAIAKKIKDTNFHVTSIKDTKRSRKASPPFMTSTLQQGAYNQLGFSVDRTMKVAQSLYEGVPLKDPSTPVALITYMRTDSLRIADSAVKAARQFITHNYGAHYVPKQAQIYSKQKAQDAHEAIRPIDVNITPESIASYLTHDAARLYELIWKRFTACQMNPAEYAQRQVSIEGGPYTFKVTGSTLLFDGFLKVYSEAEEEESEGKIIIPAALAEQQQMSADKISPKQHFTQPPARFTEATLVKEMEKDGIGRPSTYAAILRTIQARAYTTVDAKKKFTPTELGMAVTKMLTQHFPQIMTISFTAKMEEALDMIAQGTIERDVLLRSFYQEFEKDVAAFAGQDVKKTTEKTGLTCPTCKKGELVIRFGKAGSFLGCNKYPDCKFTSKFERDADGGIKLISSPEPEVLAELCPKCGKNLRKIIGRFGPFISCSGYPECTYIKPTTAGFKCPTCKEGSVVQKVWKGKKFWSCSRYPTCTFSVSGDIEETPCPRCKLPFMLKRTDKDGHTILVCSNKECAVKS